RVKKDVKENVPGLTFINKLKAVTYHLDVEQIRSFLGEDRKETEAAEKNVSTNNNDKVLIDQGVKEKEKILYTGFVAQDVEKAAKEIGYDFSGVDAPKNKDDYYGLRYGDFVVPLVKAVQELSTENDALKNDNAQLKSEIGNMKSEMNQLKAMMQ